MVAFEDFESINKFSRIPLELIDFFRIDSRTSVVKKQSKRMARKNNASSCSKTAIAIVIQKTTSMVEAANVSILQKRQMA